MQYSQIGSVQVSKLIMGSNPFSGFSHQGIERDNEMRHYFSLANIKRTLFEAEAVGINTLIARSDFHVIRMLMEYRDEGGKLQWFAQTCPEVGSHEVSIMRAAQNQAKAVHLHGGVMDYAFAQGKLDEVQPALDLIRAHGMLAGIAAHNYRVIEWARDHLDLDYFMCCYYNPTPRDENAEHVHGAEERYLAEDREKMTALFPSLRQPVIHYKILAAGRNEPGEAFRYTAARMRANDAVCVGVFPKDKAEMVAEDARLLDEALASAPASLQFSL